MPLDDPSSWRFAVPTITNELPDLREDPPRSDALQLLDDLWRACELVARERLDATVDDLAAIHDVVAEAGAQPGYVRCHQRHGLPDALAGRLGIEELLLGVGASRAALGDLAIAGHGAVDAITRQGAVDRGFALVLDERADGVRTYAYGVTRPGSSVLELLGVCGVGGRVARPTAALSSLAASKGLAFVDWFAPQVEDPPGKPAPR